MVNLTEEEIEALAEAIGKNASTMTVETTISEQTNEQESTPTLDALQEVDVNLDVVFGRTKVSIAELLSIQEGHVIHLNKHVGDYVEIESNGELLARGEVVVNGEQFGIKITEIKPEESLS